MTGWLCTLKGLPLTYNKDLQEDKEPLFDSVETITSLIKISCGVIETLTVNPDKMKAALSSEMLATDIAYYLVRKGVPFRDAHHVSGECVQLAEFKNTDLDKLTLEDFMVVSAKFESDILDIFDYEKSMEQYNAKGGTGSKSILWQIDVFEQWLKTN